MIITTEKAIKLAQNYIQRNEIEDQDLQQDIYLAALEWKSKVDNGYSRSFSQYANEIVKSKQHGEELAYDLYDALCNKSYTMKFDIEFSNELLYQMSKLSKRKQKILWEYFIQDKSYASIGREYGVTGDRISQIARQACRELRSSSVLREMYSPHCMVNNTFITSFKDLIENDAMPERMHKPIYDIYKNRPKTYQEAWRSNTDITNLDCVGLKFMETLENGDKLFSIFYKENWFIMHIHVEHDELVFVGDPKIITEIPMRQLSKVIEFINNNYDKFN